MSKMLWVFVLALSFLSGCASVPMESEEKSELAKKFNPPSKGNSGLYVYRSGSFGGALKKDIHIDGKCLGESARNVFFYEEVKGDTTHKITTESEFSPNELLLKVAAGKNYFVRQFIKMGAFVGGADLELVSEEEGKQAVSELSLAKKGTCGD